MKMVFCEVIRLLQFIEYEFEFNLFNDSFLYLFKLLIRENLYVNKVRFNIGLNYILLYIT